MVAVGPHLSLERRLRRLAGSPLLAQHLNLCLQRLCGLAVCSLQLSSGSSLYREKQEGRKEGRCRLLGVL